MNFNLHQYDLFTLGRTSADLVLTQFMKLDIAGCATNDSSVKYERSNSFSVKSACTCRWQDRQISTVVFNCTRVKHFLVFLLLCRVRGMRWCFVISEQSLPQHAQLIENDYITHIHMPQGNDLSSTHNNAAQRYSSRDWRDRAKCKTTWKTRYGTKSLFAYIHPTSLQQTYPAVAGYILHSPPQSAHSAFQSPNT